MTIVYGFITVGPSSHTAQHASFFTLQGEGSIMTSKLRQKREERKASHIVLFPVNIQTLEHRIYVGMA